MKYAVLFFFSIILSGCKPSESDLIKMGEESMRAEVTNPESAVFSSWLIPASEGFVVCGFVSHKGYDGTPVDPYRYMVYLYPIGDGEYRANRGSALKKDKDIKETFPIVCKRNS